MVPDHIRTVHRLRPNCNPLLFHHPALPNRGRDRSRALSSLLGFPTVHSTQQAGRDQTHIPRGACDGWLVVEWLSHGGETRGSVIYDGWLVAEWLWAGLMAVRREAA